MSGSEEDPYSRIFSSLKHPTRRLLLRSLKEQPFKRFSKLQSELGIDSPTLSYHLDSLTGLVDKKGDGYSLTELGVAASNLMGRVEETERARTPALSHRVRFGVGLVMVLVLLAWGMFALTWTIPNDRVSIVDSVVHGQQVAVGIPLSVQPSTNMSYVLEMFHRPPRPGEWSTAQPKECIQCTYVKFEPLGGQSRLCRVFVSGCLQRGIKLDFVDDKPPGFSRPTKLRFILQRRIFSENCFLPFGV